MGEVPSIPTELPKILPSQRESKSVRLLAVFGPFGTTVTRVVFPETNATSTKSETTFRSPLRKVAFRKVSSPTL